MISAIGGKHHFKIDLYVGKDWLLHFVPRPWRLRIIARKVLRRFGNPECPAAGEYTFSLPGESIIYEISSPTGATRPFNTSAT